MTEHAVSSKEAGGGTLAQRARLLRVARRALRAWTSGDLSETSAALLVEQALETGADGEPTGGAVPS